MTENLKLAPFTPTPQPPPCEICYSIQASTWGCHCCHTNYCTSCISEWFSNQIADISFDPQTSRLSCPNCKCQLTCDAALQLLQHDPAAQRRAEDQLFKSYLHLQDDVVRCPRQGCSYAAVRAEATCTGPYQCSICSTEWREKGPSPFERMIRAPRKELQDFMSTLHEHSLADACPRCGISISKNGGCEHVFCSRCQYDFCWFCKHAYINHNEELCFLTIFVKVLLVGMFLTAVVTCSGLWPYVARLLVLVLWNGLWFNGALGMLFCCAYNVNMMVERPYDRKYYAVFAALCGSAFACLVFPVIYYNYLLTFVAQIVLELGLGLLVMLGIYADDTWIQLII